MQLHPQLIAERDPVAHTPPSSRIGSRECHLGEKIPFQDAGEGWDFEYLSHVEHCRHCGSTCDNSVKHTPMQGSQHKIKLFLRTLTLELLSTYIPTGKYISCGDVRIRKPRERQKSGSHLDSGMNGEP